MRAILLCWLLLAGVAKAAVGPMPLFFPGSVASAGGVSYLSSNYVVTAALSTNDVVGDGTTSNSSWGVVLSNNVSNGYLTVGLHYLGTVATNSALTKVRITGPSYSNQLSLLVASNYDAAISWGVYGGPLGNLLSNAYTVSVITELPFDIFTACSGLYWNVNQTNAPTNFVATYNSALDGNLTNTVSAATNDYVVSFNFANGWTSGEDPSWSINQVLPEHQVLSFGESALMSSLQDSNRMTLAECVFQELAASTANPTWGLGFRMLYLTNSPASPAGGCDSINDSSLKAYWAAEDDNDSKGSNNLSDNNGTGSGTGKIMDGWDFQQSMSHFKNIADNADMSVGGTDYTISYWFKPTSLAALDMIAAKGTTYFCTLRTTGTSNFGFEDVGQVGCASSVAVSTGNWYHVVNRFKTSDNSCSIVVNNSAPDTGTFTTPPTDEGGDFNVGCYQGILFFADGVMDELLFTKRLLTDAEVTALYNSGAACRPSGL